MTSEEYIIERIKELEKENEKLKNVLNELKSDNEHYQNIIDDVVEDIFNNSTNYPDYFYVSVGINFNSKIATELNITHDEIEKYKNKRTDKND